MSESATEGRVHAERQGRILKIVIDRPEKKNAFSPAMLRQLSDALTDLDADDALWVGVLCAAGDHFTAGLDMPQFFGPKASAKPLPEGNVDPFGMAKRCRKPLVTAVQGIVYTVGIEMMLAGDIVVAADDSRFCQMEAKRGIAPLGGAHFRYVERAGWGNAMYHLMLCDEFSAAEALRIGLVQEVCEVGDQLARATAIAETIARQAPLGVQATLRSARVALEQGPAAALAPLLADVRAVMASDDAREGLQSFVERREARFTGR